MGGVEPVDVLIVTAVHEEYAAVLEAGGGADAWVEDKASTGLTVALKDVETIDGGRLRLAVTQALVMGGPHAVIASASLLHELGVQCLAMCGVCAGKKGEVELGDVIVADRVWEYDAGKRKVEVVDGKRVEHHQGDIEMYRLHPPAWKQAAERFEIDADAAWLKRRPRSYEAQGDWILKRVLEGADPSKDANCETKCADWDKVLARLWKKGLLEDRTLTLTTAGREHIERVLLVNRGVLPEARPVAVHVGPIASGSQVMQDDEILARLSEPVRKVLGVDMEAAAIGALAQTERLPYAVVMKAVMDHADADKSNNFKAFAARASAEVLLAFVRQHVMPRVVGEADQPAATREAARARYRQAIVSRFGSLEGPGGRVPLDDVYEELPLLMPDKENKEKKGRASDPHVGWAQFLGESGGGGQVKRALIEEILRTHVAVVVLADPGAGKTTLLRATARRLAQGVDQLPLYVHLGRWPQPLSIIEAALAEAAWSQPAPAKAALLAEIKAAREAGRITILVDGVDEVAPGRLKEQAEQLGDFLGGAGPGKRVVIASRPAGDVSALEQHLPASARAERCYLAVLDPQQVPRVAERWLRAFGSKASAAALVEQARRTDESWRLAHNPLLLRGMCMLFADGALELPANLTGLIDKMAKYLTQRGVEEIGRQYDAVPATVSSALEWLHEETAGVMATTGKSVLELDVGSYPEVFDQVAAKVGRPVGALLEWLAPAGLLTRAGEDRWCFVHRTFEERYTGKWLARVHGRDAASFIAWVQAHAIDPAQGSCRRELFEALRWAGAYLPPATTKAFVLWLIANDSVIFDGTILGARILAMAGDDVLRACAPLVDDRLREMFEGAFSMETLTPWPSGLRAYVARRTALADLANEVPWEHWLSLLWDPACRAPMAAVKALVALGARGHAPAILLELIHDKHEDQQGDIIAAAGRAIVSGLAVEALADLGARDHVPAIVEFLKDKRGDVRRAAVKALATLGARDQVPAIAELLKDVDWSVRSAAVVALWALDARDVGPTFVRLLNDEYMKPADEYLAFRFKCDRVRFAEYVAAELKALGARELVPAIAELLKDEDDKVREAAVEALRALDAQEQAPLIAQVLHVCNDAGSGFRCSAIGALRALGAREQVPVVAEFLRYEHSFVRSAAVYALGKLGAKEQVPAIVELLKDEDEKVRDAAVEALGALGAQEQVPAIAELLKDSNKWVREAAVKALATLGAGEQVPAIAELLKDRDVRVRGFAVDALATLGARDHVPAIVELLKDRSWVCVDAVKALGALGAQEQVPAIAELLKDDREWVCEAAVEALATLGAREQAAAIVELLKDEGGAVGRSREQGRLARRHIVWALAALGAWEQAPAFVELLKDEDEHVRRAAVGALAALSARDQVPAIAKLLKDGDENVRAVAVEALRSFGWVKPI